MSYSRRRFLTDLLFTGGAIAAAAGLAATAEPEPPKISASPTTPSATPSASPSECPKDLPMPGQMIARPSPSPTATPNKIDHRALPGGMPPPSRPH